MGCEIRRVPAGWSPPKDKPHFDESFDEAFGEWQDGLHLWLTGQHPDQIAGTGRPEYYESTAAKYSEWDGSSPDPDYYRPAWTDEERTHYMLYETVSEGTAMSPAFATLEKLGEWMLTNPDPVWGQRSPEAVARFLEGGYAPSMVYTPQRGLEDGITALGPNR